MQEMYVIKHKNAMNKRVFFVGGGGEGGEGHLTPLYPISPLVLKGIGINDLFFPRLQR